MMQFLATADAAVDYTVPRFREIQLTVDQASVVVAWCQEVFFPDVRLMR